MNDGETQTWLERRERLKETANNGNGAGMPLAVSAALWMIPAEQVAAKGMATNWGTPTSRDWKDGTSKDADCETNRLLGREVIRCTLPVRGWVERALSMTFENFSEETLSELGSFIGQNSPTPSDGSKSSTDGLSSPPPSTSKPRLNPLFSSWHMMWHPFWISPEPMRCAPVEMELYRSQQRSHLSHLLAGLE
jgi:hypothetical protein